MRLSPPVLFAAVAPALIALGCGGTPSGANIHLRKELQQRDDQISQLKRQHQADLADLHAHSGPTTTALPPEELAKLVTTHGISFGRLTGESNLDANTPEEKPGEKPGEKPREKPGYEMGDRAADRGLKIYVVPTDDDGQPLKAAGTFTVEAFDLAFPDNNLIGKWTFDLNATRQNWFGQVFLYTYILPCPWQQHVPTNSQLTLRVTFHDELTGREFEEQKVVNLKPPPSANP